MAEVSTPEENVGDVTGRKGVHKEKQMQRRKFLVGMGSLAAGSAAAIGTGAFSYAEADRQVTVNTVGDNSAYMKLDGDNEYVTDNNGELVIDLGGPGNGFGGQGFNRDAATRVGQVVEVTNQGPNDLSLSLSGDGGSVNTVTAVSNVDLSSGEGIYFAVDGGNLNSGNTAYINVAVVEGVNDGNNGVPGGTLTIIAD